MANRRGRPASKNPRIHRIETRINEKQLQELNSICSRTNISKTNAIDWAIHITYLALSDSRTRESVMKAFRFKPYSQTKKKMNFTSAIIDSLSDVNERFPDINEKYLEFIQFHENNKTPENEVSSEEIVALLIEAKYLQLREYYTKKEVLLFGISEDIY